MLWTAKRVAYAAVREVAETLECPEPLAWTLVRRGLDSPDAAREFMASDGPLRPPQALAGAFEAAARLEQALERDELVAIHGDYDCDGVCSTAILTRALRARGGRVRTFLPSRFVEGYGVAPETIDTFIEEGVQLLVCVDCGTSAEEPISRARAAGIDVIVADHHLAGGRRPDAILVNPALGRPPDDAPAAAGVVFTICRALAEREGSGVLAAPVDDELDLVGLATVADSVPLVGENRRFVARALATIRERPRTGLAALFAAAESDHRWASARTLGFTLAPAINAVGRLERPDRALELLLATEDEVALPLGRELWRLNSERREIERRITEEAIAQVEAAPPEQREAAALIAAGDGWHEGVVGIVASRLAERFSRPAIVIAISGDQAKGSGRSVPGVDLHGIVADADGPLERWGGHEGAVGLSLAADRITDFRTELTASAEGHRAQIERSRIRTVDAVVGGSDLTLPTAEAFEGLAPFGRGNPAVRLAIPGARISDVRRVGGGRHLQLRVHSAGAHARAVGFSQGERAAGLDPEARHDLVTGLEVERWQDRVGARVQIQGIAPLADDLAPDPAPAILGTRDPAGLLEWAVAPPEEAPPGRPRAVIDLRGQGASLTRLVALSGADRGVVAVVADAGRRSDALRGVLGPGRLDVEHVVVARGGDDPAAVRRALAPAAGAFLGMVEYELLPDIAIPDGVHLVALDPPGEPALAGWLIHRSDDRWLHLTWGEDEGAFAESVIDHRLDVTAAARALWRALREGPRTLDRALAEEADGDLVALARSAAVLREMGLVAPGPNGALGLRPGSGPRDLGESDVFSSLRDRLTAARALLARHATLEIRATGDGAGVAA